MLLLSGHDLPVPRGQSRAKSATTQATSTTRVATTKYTTGHLYTLDLRSHTMSHLTVADQIIGTSAGVSLRRVTNESNLEGTGQAA